MVRKAVDDRTTTASSGPFPSENDGGLSTVYQWTAAKNLFMIRSPYATIIKIRRQSSRDYHKQPSSRKRELLNPLARVGNQERALPDWCFANQICGSRVLVHFHPQIANLFN